MKPSLFLLSPGNIIKSICRFFWHWIMVINYFFDKKEIHVGDYYTDCGYIPRIAVEATVYEVTGKSLIDGSLGNCNVHYCAPVKVTKEQAEEIVRTGPLDPKTKQWLKEFYASEWGTGRTIWWKE